MGHDTFGQQAFPTQPGAARVSVQTASAALPLVNVIWLICGGGAPVLMTTSLAMAMVVCLLALGIALLEETTILATQADAAVAVLVRFAAAAVGVSKVAPPQLVAVHA